MPLDHSGGVRGTVTLRVFHGPALHPSDPVTLVLPSAPGVGAAELAYWKVLMPRQRMLSFEPRGTGAGALRCRDLEAATFTDASREAAACATLLGEKRRFFRASDTVEDIELIRARLGIQRLTIVGPGYGAYVAQRYVLRYPERVARLIVTNPVDAAGIDPLYRDSVAAARRVLLELCRSRCGRFTRDPIADTRRLVGELASAPLRGSVVGPRGRHRETRLNRQELLFTLLASDGSPFNRADFPAAVVSALHGDAAPLLRLKRRATKLFSAIYPRYASAATAAAATCEEAQFPWAWRASPAERAEAAHRAETQLGPAVADPFDPGTLVRSDVMRLCGRWPTASPGPPPEPGPMPDVPVLVVANSTVIGSPVETAARVAARFPRSRLLVNSEFATLGVCGERAVRRFMRAEPVQDRCPRAGPLIPATAPLPASLKELAPWPGVPGSRGRLVRAFAVTFADLVDDFFASFFLNPDALFGRHVFRGGGLRGGSYVLNDELLSLRRYEFVPGVRLTGRWLGGVQPRSQGPLRVDGPGRLDGVIRLGATDKDLMARVRGRIAGSPFRVRMLVPSRLVEVADERGALARAAALPWRLRCEAPRVFSPLRSRPGSSSLLPLMPRCASSAAAGTASPARG